LREVQRSREAGEHVAGLQYITVLVAVLILCFAAEAVCRQRRYKREKEWRATRTEKRLRLRPRLRQHAWGDDDILHSRLYRLTKAVRSHLPHTPCVFVFLFFFSRFFSVF
jgi:hypothetical protein